MSTPTTSYQIAEWEDEDFNDGNWPYPTRYVQFAIEGELADRIRARLGAHESEGVTITEVTTSGGYSEFTQETDVDFEVECGRHSIKFGQYDVQGQSWNTPPVVRLQAWLEQNPVEHEVTAYGEPTKGHYRAAEPTRDGAVIIDDLVGLQERIIRQILAANN